MKKREVKAVKRLFKENIKDQEKFDIVYSKVFGAVILRYECNGKVEVAENYHDIRELSDELLFQWEYDYIYSIMKEQGKEKMTNEEYVRSMDDCTRERIEKQKMKFKIAFQEIAEMN